MTLFNKTALLLSLATLSAIVTGTGSAQSPYPPLPTRAYMPPPPAYVQPGVSSDSGANATSGFGSAVWQPLFTNATATPKHNARPKTV